MTIFCATLLSNTPDLNRMLFKLPRINLDPPTGFGETPVLWRPFAGIQVCCQRISARAQTGNSENTLIIRVPDTLSMPDTVQQVLDTVDVWCLARILNHGFIVLRGLCNNHRMMFSESAVADTVMGALYAARAVLDNERRDSFHIDKLWDRCERMARAASHLNAEQRGMASLISQPIPVMFSFTALFVALLQFGSSLLLWMVLILYAIYTAVFLYQGGMHPVERYRFRQWCKQMERQR